MTAMPTWAGTYQIGLVVRDLEAARRHFESIGIGPFEDGPSAIALERHVYGRPAPDVEVRGLTARMGPIEFELMQPVRGESIQAETLRTRGEGVIHLCAYTDDLDRDSVALIAAGFAPISTGRFHDGGRFAYFDTRSVGGLILELFQTGHEIR